MNSLKQLPKIELHLHLDGSVDLNIASKITNRSIKDLKKEMQVKESCQSLTDYLKSFKLPLEMMQTKENIEMISTALAQNLKEDNVIYAEIRFAPNLHTQKELSLNEIVESVLNGLKKIDIKTNLILCCMRNNTIEQNKQIIDLAKDWKNKGVVAIDLAGDEANYQTKNFKELFEYAKQLNIPYTIHAGEADHVSSVEAAINFGAKRIGHGIHIIENEKLMNLAISNKILLEVCPTSNVQTLAVPNLNEHPIKKLFKKNIPICINTDNRTVSNITLTEEYQKLKNTFNFTTENFIKMNINAINASFLSNDEKETLKKQYQNKLEQQKI